MVRNQDNHAFVAAIEQGGRHVATIEEASGIWLNSTIRLTVDAAQRCGAGNGALVERLAEVLIAEVLRQYMRLFPENQTDWLLGFKDRHVGKALRLMHREPSRDWTVGQLARESGVSTPSDVHESFEKLRADDPGNRCKNGLRIGFYVQPCLQTRCGHASRRLA